MIHEYWVESKLITRTENQEYLGVTIIAQNSMIVTCQQRAEQSQPDTLLSQENTASDITLEGKQMVYEVLG